MIKIAFIKFAGLSAGGTEKFLQTVAANLPRDRFLVDYYYCDTAPFLGLNYEHAGNDPERLDYMRSHGVNLVKFSVGAVNGRKHTRDWLNTDFWEKFDERNYNIIQTGRAGFPEYPFNKIKKTPIIDSIHLFAGVDNQFNISRVMHLSECNAKKWIRAGGDKTRVVMVSHPMDIPKQKFGDLRARIGLKDKFVYGMHQRADDGIFSPIPLEAYKKIENDSNAFIIMGGGEAYRKQAERLQLKNFYFIPHSANRGDIYGFLSTLNVYAHGRKDGEINSTAMAEAMSFGLPIVSHFSKINNGHVQNIAHAGNVVASVDEYSAELKRLCNDEAYYYFRSQQAKLRFHQKYDLQSQIQNIVGIYEDVIMKPFPNVWKRRLSQLRLKYILMYSFVRVFNKIKRAAGV